MIELYILTGLMIVGALIAVETKSLIFSVISLGAVGIILSVAFLYLGAPDIAITQIVVEIVVLLVLIRATIGRDTTIISGKGEFLEIVTLAVFVGITIFFIVRGLVYIHPFGDISLPVSRVYIEEGLKNTGAANIVTSVLLDFRAYDTLGEATVLFTCIIGAIIILRKKGRKKVNEGDDRDSKNNS